MTAKNLNLSLSNIINVTVLGSSSGLGLPNINTIALISAETPDTPLTDEYLVCKNLDDVLAHYASDSEAYAIAAAVFGQNPNIMSTGGYLAIVPIAEGDTDFEDTVARVKDQIYFFGVIVDSDFVIATDLADAATYIQTLDKVLFIGSSSDSDYTATTGAFDIVRAASQTHTRCLFYSMATSTPEEFAAAYAGRALSTAFDGVNTTQTMHLKTLSGFTGDTAIDQTALDACQAAGVDVYASFGVDRLFTSGENAFFDEIYNELWLKMTLQITGFNYLSQTNSKIPQTEIGIDGLKNAYRTVCDQAVRNRFIGPGTWTSPDTIGDREAHIRCIKDIGYYVYSLPLSQQLAADRADRKAPLIQIAVKSQGAVHSSDIIVTVNA